jgi:hypothetical protein
MTHSALRTDIGQSRRYVVHGPTCHRSWAAALGPPRERAARSPPAVPAVRIPSGRCSGRIGGGEDAFSAALFSETFSMTSFDAANWTDVEDAI